MAKDEDEDLKKEISKLEDQIKILMLPKDPNDDNDIIMEIRGAAGGMKPHFLPGICLECTKSTLSVKAGRPQLSIASQQKLVVISELRLWSLVKKSLF